MATPDRTVILTDTNSKLKTVEIHLLFRAGAHLFSTIIVLYQESCEGLVGIMVLETLQDLVGS